MQLVQVKFSKFLPVVQDEQSIGILCRNGCGKSTLLQVICGMTLPSHGELRVSGRIAPVLVVAVHNTAARTDEYTPTAITEAQPDGTVWKGGGKAPLYGRFLVEELKPFIDRTYRTLPGREHTAVGGSSMGGLISLFLCKWYPEEFGLCAAVSPSLWWDRELLLRQTAKDPSWAARTEDDDHDPIEERASRFDVAESELVRAIEALDSAGPIAVAAKINIGFDHAHQPHARLHGLSQLPRACLTCGAA